MKKEISMFSIKPDVLIARLLYNWYWFVLLAGLGYMGASLYLRYQTNLYKVTASLKLKEEEDISRKIIVEDMGFDERLNLEDEIFYLKSSPLMEQVVKDLKIDVTYFAEGRIINSELYNRTPVSVAVIGDKTQAEGKSIKIAPVDSSRFELLTETDTITFHHFYIGIVQICR